MNVIDGQLLPLCRAAAATWPDESWPYWHQYRDGNSVKFGTKDPARVTPACWQLLTRMTELDAPAGTFPDLDLHAAGMHWIPEGGHLSRHRDGERHPATGWYRRWNAILFLSDCEGGELVMDGEKAVQPKLGRLVAFDSQVPHEVKRVTRGDRKSLSLFWWSLDGSGVRTSANFA